MTLLHVDNNEYSMMLYMKGEVAGSKGECRECKNYLGYLGKKIERLVWGIRR